MPTPLVRPGSSHRIWTGSEGAGQDDVLENALIGFSIRTTHEVFVDQLLDGHGTDIVVSITVE
jgi:hypothetical protein